MRNRKQPTKHLLASTKNRRDRVPRGAWPFAEALSYYEGGFFHVWCVASPSKNCRSSNGTTKCRGTKITSSRVGRTTSDILHPRSGQSHQDELRRTSQFKVSWLFFSSQHGFLGNLNSHSAPYHEANTRSGHCIKHVGATVLIKVRNTQCWGLADVSSS